jgi:proline iminopeptidase
MGTVRKIVGPGAVLLAVYAIWVRPQLKHWGATKDEVNGPYPGAELVPGGKRGATMAVTIDAPPERVWPWLVQLGGDRAGWYSWDRLDNSGRPSAREIHPEWQGLAVGDTVKYWKGDEAVDAWVVAALEPNRFLGLHGISDLRGGALDPTKPLPSAYSEGLWGFQLKELPGDRTRLVIGGYEVFRPAWLGGIVSFAFPALVWVMQARMLAVLKRNAEATVAS